MRALLNRTVPVCMWIAILCLWTWTALPDEGGNTMRSGLVGRAGAVELLEFEKQHVVRELRIVKVTDAGTNVVATTTVTGDYGKGVKIGIVQLHKGAAAGKFLLPLRFPTTAPRSKQNTFSAWIRARIQRSTTPHGSSAFRVLTGHRFTVSKRVFRVRN
jgi:hypothetical protein